MVAIKGGHKQPCWSAARTVTLIYLEYTEIFKAAKINE